MSESEINGGILLRTSFTVEPLLRGHPDEKPTPLQRPLSNIYLNINVLIYIPDEIHPS